VADPRVAERGERRAHRVLLRFAGGHETLIRPGESHRTVSSSRARTLHSPKSSLRQVLLRSHFAFGPSQTDIRSSARSSSFPS
jgi:hypothetical protein